MDLKEISEIEREYEEFYNEEDVETYISLAANLHYPTVLIEWNGNILYKNPKADKIRGKWRKGSNLKTYVGASLFNNIMATKKGEYVAVLVDDEKIAILRFDDYYFLMFMSDFEINSDHIFILYNYISCIPEKNFFVNRKLVPKENFSEKQISDYETFRRKFEHFYKDVKSCYEDIQCAYMRKSLEKEHDIVDVIMKISDFINRKSYNFSCRFSLEKRYDYYVNCSSKDLGLILGLLVFLCLQCSCTRKPAVRVTFEKKQKPYSCLLSFSVKSKLTEEDIEKLFLSEELIDERSLYFQTARNMTAKYFWGLGVKKSDDQIIFYLKIVTSRSKDMWFHDSSSMEAVNTMFSFEEFMDLLLGDIPKE